MNRQLYDFFTNDHRRIDAMLLKATENAEEIKMEHYNPFRKGLLTHIKMEEKILFPAAQKANGDIPLPIAAKLRLDHGALTALMAVPPTSAVIKVIRHILEVHDIAEGEPGGMYDVCASLTQTETEHLLKQLADVKEVPVHPPNTSAMVFEASKRALTRAGYDFEKLSQ